MVIYGHSSQKGLVYATIKLLPATTSCPFGKDEVLKGLMRLFRALTSYKVLKGKAFKGLRALEGLLRPSSPGFLRSPCSPGLLSGPFLASLELHQGSLRRGLLLAAILEVPERTGAP